MDKNNHIADALRYSFGAGARRAEKARKRFERYSFGPEAFLAGIQNGRSC